MASSDPPALSESTPAPSSVALSRGPGREGTSSLKVVAILFGVFAFGGLAGGFAGRALTFAEFRKTMSGPPGEARTRWRVEAMRRDLDLTEQQVSQVQSIMKAGEPDREAAMKACRPEVDALREKTDAQITEILTPEQRPKYAEFVKRRQR